MLVYSVCWGWSCKSARGKHNVEEDARKKRPLLRKCVKMGSTGSLIIVSVFFTFFSFPSPPHISHLYYFSWINYYYFFFFLKIKRDRDVCARARVCVQCTVWKVCRRCGCVSCDIVSCFFLLTNLLEYLRVGSFSFSGVVGDPTQAGKNKTHVTFSHGKKKKKNTKAHSEVGRIRRTCHGLLNDI